MRFDPKDIVEHLRHNLERYPYADGFPVLRELLQNADDPKAEAKSVAVSLLNGWLEAANNPLLCGPGLLLVNDGGFDADSSTGMQTFGGSVKALDEAAVGRFGLGQKSVFHLCDAFVVVPYGYETKHTPFVVNPFETLGREGDACLDWARIDDSDAALIVSAGERCISSARRLNLWFPLRRPELHPKPTSSGVVASDIPPESLSHLADRQRLAEMLASLRHVRRVAVEINGVRVELDRGAAPGMVGYALDPGDRGFGGALGSGIVSRGRERRAPDTFRSDLRRSANWPRSRNPDTDEEEPQKATPHGAAVLVIEPDSHGLSADWSVLLPVTEAFRALHHDGKGRLKLLLHGCFFVDSGRKAVIGLDDAGPKHSEQKPSNEATLRADWNRSLRDELVLPLIPAVFHDALSQQVLSGEALAAAVRALATSDFGRRHRAAIAAEHVLARCVDVTRGGTVAVAGWRLVPAGTALRPLPAPNERGRVALVELMPDVVNWAAARKLTLICGADALLAPKVPSWNPDELKELLAGLAPECLASDRHARVLTAFLTVACANDDLSVAAAGPVIDRLRKAIASARVLAPHDRITEVLAAVDCAGIVPLPPSASERYVLRALAQAQDAPPCLPRAWLPEAAGDSLTLDADKARPLIAALQPLFANEAQGEAAGAASLAIVRRLKSLETALARPDLCKLPVVRAFDGSANRLLSLAELDAAAREERLFRDTGPARKVLKLLGAALPGSKAFILPSKVADALPGVSRGPSAEPTFRLADLDAGAACSLARKAEAFGPPQARAALLNNIFTEDAGKRDALRALAAGDRRALNSSVQLKALRETAPALDALIARLIATSAQYALVPAEVIDKLDRGKARHLSIATIGGEELGDLLCRHAEELPERGLDRKTAEAILCAGIPEESLRKLPILPTTRGGWARPDDLYQSNPGWPVPASMTALVPMLGDIVEQKAKRCAEDLVHYWSPEAQIALCLDQPEPSRFAAEIIEALTRVDGPDLGRLGRVPWLVDRRSCAWKPEDVLDLPDEILTAARQALGDDLPFLPVSDITPALRDRPDFAALRDRRVLPDGADSLDALLLMVEAERPVAYMGEVSEELARALTDLAAAGAVLPLSGWPLLAAVLRAFGKDDQKTQGAREVLAHFGTADSASCVDVGDWLNALAKMAQEKHSTAHAAKSSARVAYEAGFRAMTARPISSFRAIMGKVLVPTAADSWRLGCEVTARCTGVAPDVLLGADLAELLPPHDDPAAPEEEPTDDPLSIEQAEWSEEDCAQSLVALLTRLRAQVPEQALAQFAALVVDRDLFKRLARDQLALTEAQIQALQDSLGQIVRNLPSNASPSTDNFSRLRKDVRLYFKLTTGGQVQVRTLDGEFRNAPSAIRASFQVLGAGHEQPRRLKAEFGTAVQNTMVHEITLAESDGHIDQQTFEQLIETVARLALWHFDHYRNTVLEQLQQALSVEEATVEDACARLEDRLPRILAELKPTPGSRLKEALNRYETKEQSIPPPERAGLLPDAKRALWEDVTSAETAAELLGLIRQGIEHYGYGPARLVFELFQNADDATLQHPPEGTSICRVRFETESLRLLHWGRLINHLGPVPVDGERKGWQRDLFNMLLMNLSEKREEVTGRFGLGFKSVHLIAREVGIASGFEASCRVKGGMLPEIWEGGRTLSLDESRDGRRATLIDLEIDPERHAEAEKARAAFANCVRWLPATARVIREIELNGRRFKARFAETGATGIRHVVFEGAEPGQALALLLDENTTGNTTLFLPLSSDGPQALPETLARLWLLAPLEEECRAGWLLNSYGFRVDPGRGRLAGSVDERAALFGRLGRALGQKLVELYDLIEGDWTGFAEGAGLADRNAASGRALFIERLVHLFKGDVSRDADDERLETHLHREGGLPHLFRKREALPTGLPAPFAPFLRADQVRWQIAEALAETNRVNRLTGWRALADIGETAVNSEAAKLLQQLGFEACPIFGAAALLRAELREDQHADPETAARLGDFFDDNFVEALTGTEQQELLKAAAEAKFLMADGSWCEARLAPRDAVNADEEERRILAFAPDTGVADGSYANTALSFYRLAARQSGFQRTAETFERWAREMVDQAARCALLAYVAEGGQGERLGALLARARPHWLPDGPEELRQSTLLEGFDDDTRGRLLTILYPSLARSIGAGRWRPFDPRTGEPEGTPPDPAEELARIRDWWQREHTVQRRDYDARAWPDGFLPGRLRDREATDDRLGWFTFFALGIFRTLGWNNQGAHKSFVEAAVREGWWQEMAEASFANNALTEGELSKAAMPWLKRLEDFARPDVWKIDFPQWRRTISDLYALARWLPDYAEAFRLLPWVIDRQRPVSLSRLWRLSYEPIWQRRGLEGAPLAQSLGLGANWMIREAIRHGLWLDDESIRMQPYAWAATERLHRLFKDWPGNPISGRGHMDLSPDIHRFVFDHLGPDAAFLGDLDLPLQLWNGDGHEPADVSVYNDENEE